MKKSEMTYRIEPIDPAPEKAFDIENWLADLLVDYWLSNHNNINGGK